MPYHVPSSAIPGALHKLRKQGPGMRHSQSRTQVDALHAGHLGVLGRQQLCIQHAERLRRGLVREQVAVHLLKVALDLFLRADLRGGPCSCGVPSKRLCRQAGRPAHSGALDAPTWRTVLIASRWLFATARILRLPNWFISLP